MTRTWLVATAVLAGCMGEVEPPANVLAGLTPLAQARLSPTRTVEFYDSDSGIVIRETGHVDELAQRRLDLDGLRGQGVSGMYRALMEGAPVPATLAAAEQRWAVRAGEVIQRPATAPPGEAGLQRFGVGDRPLLAVPEDADWWQGLPICQAVESTGSFEGPRWYDGVWCPIDVTWANTGFRDTMYYEATGFGEDGAATIYIWKWTGSEWRQVIQQDIAHRTYQTFSFPPENRAFFQTRVEGERDQDGNPSTLIGLSERFRLALPQPSFINFSPSQAGFKFSTDINGITHDANHFFMTRTDHNIAAPVSGHISRTPIGGRLDVQPPRVVEMPVSWRNPDGSGSPTRYNHFGDLVHVNGFLFVAMEGPAGAAVGVFDTELNPIGFAALSASERSCPWLAHNPRNNLFYVSFGARKPLGIYSITVGTSVQAGRVGTLQLSGAIGDQGGKFSPRGNLWSVSGYGGSSSLRLFAVDSVNGQVHLSTGIPANGADEAEGLDIIDLDADGRAPGMSGQLHFMTLENTIFGRDKFSLGHFRADMGRL